MWQPEGNGGDGRRGIVAHALQVSDGRIVGGKRATMVGHNLAGGGMQVAGAAVVAQSLPHLQHLCFGGGGEGGAGGKCLQKAAIVVHALHHTGLLQNHLRDPDAVRIGFAAPRQIALVGVEPVEQAFCKHHFFGKKKGKRLASPMRLVVVDDLEKLVELGGENNLGTAVLGAGFRRVGGVNGEILATAGG